MKYKLYTLTLLSIIMILSLSIAFAETTPKLIIDNQEIQLDSPIVIKNDTIFMPLTDTLTAMDILVKYDDKSKTIYGYFENDILYMTINSNKVKYDTFDENSKPIKKSIELSTPISVINSRSYISLTDIEKIYPCKTTWNANTRTATIAYFNRIYKRVDYDDGYYEGEFRDGKKDGQGKYVLNDGDIYEGHWKNGLKQGICTYTGADGDVYYGNWENNYRNGLGTLTFTNGVVCEGNFISDVAHGQIKWADSEGNIYQGKIINDESFYGKCTSHDTNETYYIKIDKDGNKTRIDKPIPKSNFEIQINNSNFPKNDYCYLTELIGLSREAVIKKLGEPNESNSEYENIIEYDDFSLSFTSDTNQLYCVNIYNGTFLGLSTPQREEPQIEAILGKPTTKEDLYRLGIIIEYIYENDTILSFNLGSKQVTFTDNTLKNSSNETQSDNTFNSNTNNAPVNKQNNNFRSQCTNSPSYYELLKNPTPYLDAPVHFSAKVIQAIENTDGSSFFLADNSSDTNGWVDYFNENPEYWSLGLEYEDSQPFAVFSDSRVDILQDDNVDFYGIVLPNFTYETTLGLTKTVPAIKLVEYDNRTAEIRKIRREVWGF